MTGYSIAISEPAENDLRDIVRYISTQFNAPMTALKMLDLVVAAINSLENMPRRCPLVPDERLARMGYRKMIIKNYIVFFTIDESSKVVDVERIIHTRCDRFKII